MDYLEWLSDLLRGTYGIEESRIREEARRIGMKRRELQAARMMLGVKTLTVWGDGREPETRFWFLPGEGPGERRA